MGLLVDKVHNHTFKIDSKQISTRSNLSGITPILGYECNPKPNESFTRENFVNGRLFSYIPVIGSFYGISHTWNSIKMLWDRVICNDNLLIGQRKIGHTNTNEFFPVELIVTDRLILAASAVAQIVRGLFEIFSLGFVFIPFDLLASSKLPTPVILDTLEDNKLFQCPLCEPLSG